LVALDMSFSLEYAKVGRTANSPSVHCERPARSGAGRARPKLFSLIA